MAAGSPRQLCLQSERMDPSCLAKHKLFASSWELSCFWVEHIKANSTREHCEAARAGTSPQGCARALLMLWPR